MHKLCQHWIFLFFSSWLMNNEFDIWPWNYKIIVLSFSVCDRHNKLISWQFGLFEAHKKQKHMSSKLKFHHLIKTFNNMETLWVFLALRERERESHLGVVRFRVWVCVSPVDVSVFSFSMSDSGCCGDVSPFRSPVWLCRSRAVLSRHPNSVFNQNRKPISHFDCHIVIWKAKVTFDMIVTHFFIVVLLSLPLSSLWSFSEIKKGREISFVYDCCYY